MSLAETRTIQRGFLNDTNPQLTSCRNAGYRLFLHVHKMTLFSSLRRRIPYFVITLIGTAILALLYFTTFANAEARSDRPHVIDGDTISVDGHVYRLIGFDAPETGERARCPDEARRGKQATLRLRAIVREGNLSLERLACTCSHGKEGTEACNYGRWCGALRANGRDVSEIMIAEGLARPYVCAAHHCPQRSNWCFDAALGQ